MKITVGLVMPINNKPAKATPLQRVLGFEAAEETYDLLNLREQLIVDLRIEGWSQDEIGKALGLSQGWVSIIFKQIRFKLAESNLRKTLELRQYYRETTAQVRESGNNDDSDFNDNY